MPTEFCQKCKQSHPGRACDYDDQGDCAETVDESSDKKNGATDAPARPPSKKSKES